MAWKSRSEGCLFVVSESKAKSFTVGKKSFMTDEERKKGRKIERNGRHPFKSLSWRQYVDTAYVR